MFITLEDETDTANLVIWPSLFARQRTLILQAGLMAARGRVQREGEVIHLVAEHLIDRSDLLGRVAGIRVSRWRSLADGATRRGAGGGCAGSGAAVAGGEPGFPVRCWHWPSMRRHPRVGTMSLAITSPNGPSLRAFVAAVPVVLRKGSLGKTSSAKR